MAIDHQAHPTSQLAVASSCPLSREDEEIQELEKEI
jgi:hypothetical protein